MFGELVGSDFKKLSQVANGLPMLAVDSSRGRSLHDTKDVVVPHLNEIVEYLDDILFFAKERALPRYRGTNCCHFWTHLHRNVSRLSPPY